MTTVLDAAPTTIQHVAAMVASSTRQSDRHGPYLLSRFGTALSGNLNRLGFDAGFMPMPLTLSSSQVNAFDPGKVLQR